MAHLCGVTVGTMEYYYIYHNEMKNAAKWIGFDKPSVEDEEAEIEKAALRIRTADLITQVHNAPRLEKSE